MTPTKEAEMGESIDQTTRKVIRASRLKAGMVLADGGQVVERVELAAGKRTQTHGSDADGASVVSGWPIDVDVVRVFIEGADPRHPRRLWPRQKVEVIVRKVDARPEKAA